MREEALRARGATLHEEDDVERRVYKIQTFTQRCQNATCARGRNVRGT